MQQTRKLLKRTLSGILSAALLLSGMAVPAFAAEAPGGAGTDLLLYTVADGLDFDDTGVFASSDEAWAHADKIVSHVEGEVEKMREVFARKTVKITDAPYNAESHTVFPIVEGTYKKSAEDAAAEAELAKKNTQAIYNAIKAVSDAGGGTVVVPAQDGKVFYTSAIHLEDNVNLCIEEGAVLKFTTDTSLYVGDLMKQVYGKGVDGKGLTLTRFESVELMNYSPFIYAYGKKNIAITGKGTLDGQATTGNKSDPNTMVWHQWKSKRNYTKPDGTKVEIEAQNKPRTKLFGQGQTDVPVAQRQYGESASEDWSGADDGFLRPNFVQPYKCQNVLIEGVTVVNSPMWELNPVLCDTVMVQDVTINSHLHNNDGCDPECTSNMVIRKNHIDTGDDCVAIKSGRNGDGLRVSRSSFNIVIQDNVFVDGHGGVTIGSEITNGVKNIFSRDNEMNSNQLQAAYRFKTNYIRGGVIENIYYKDDTVKMVEPKKPVILVDLNYDISKEVGMMKDMNVSYQAYSPAFKHVLFENMQVNLAEAANSGGQYAMQLKGFNVSGIDPSCTIPEGMQDCYISDFTIKDSTFVGSKQAFDMVNVDGLTLDNVTIRGTTGNDAVTNCKNLTFKNCDFSDSNVKRETFENIASLPNTLFKGETTPPVEGLKLTYEVADGLDFEDTSVFADSDEAWAHADKIVSHVEGAVSDMRKIFARKTVKITDAPYNAESHAEFPINKDTYKKSEADAAAEAELAKKNTAAIYAAIKDVSEAGGGTVVVPAQNGKVFYTSAIHLEDNVNLCIEKDAVLKFTTDTSLYVGDLMKQVYGSSVDDQGLTLTRFEAVELMNYSPFIYAYGKKNIAITGEGTLDGQASVGDKKNGETMVWHQWKNKRTYTKPDGTPVSIEAQNNPRTKLFSQGQTDVPVAQRQYGESASEDWSGADDGFLRPNFVQPYNCQNVLIEGVTVVNSPMWELNPVLCDTVMVQDVTINSHLHNNDGCDPECTSNIVIRNNHIDTGDDCVAIKSGRNGDGLRVSRPSFNIVIQDNVFVDGHGGVTIGSEITNGVKNIFSRDNEMNSNQLQAAYRFKTNYIRGGVIENIYYKNDTVKMVELKRPVILVDLNYDIKKEVDMMKTMKVDYQAYSPAFKHVLFENMQVNLDNAKDSGGEVAMQLKGFNVSGIDPSCTIPDGMQDCYITDFTIKDSTFVGSKQAFDMVNVDGLTLDNVTIRGTTKTDSVTNCKNLKFLYSDFHESNVERSTFEDISTIVDTIFKGETRPVTGITLDKDSLTLDVDETAVLHAEISPANATNQNVEWSTSDPKIVRVVNGEVIAVGAGKATITATTEDGGFTAECEVTVRTVLSADVESANGTDILTALIDTSSRRITLSGIAAIPDADGTEVKLTFHLPEGGTQEETLTLTYEDGKLAVDPDTVEVDGVRYRVDVEGVVPTNVTVEIKETDGSVDKNLELDKEDRDAALDAAKSVEGDVKTIVSESAQELADAFEEIDLDKYDEVKAIVWLKVAVTDYKAPDKNSQPSLKLDITPVYKIVGTAGSEETDLVDEIPLTDRKYNPVNISVNLPDGFVRSLLDLVVAKHYAPSGKVKEWLPVTLLDSNGGFQARFKATSFSEYELIANPSNVTVIYQLNSGKTLTVHYDPTDIGDDLETDRKDGFTFLGWSTEQGASRAAYSGELTEEMLNEMCEEMDEDGKLKLYPVFGKQQSGTSFPSYSGGASHEVRDPLNKNTSTKPADKTLNVSIDAGSNGSVSASPRKPVQGDRVTVTVTPDDGYVLDTIEATTGNGRTVALTEQDENEYTFTMPSSDVSIEATFKPDENAMAAEPEPVSAVPSVSYVDVTSSDWFRTAVDYVTVHGVMSGSGSSFSPNSSLTRSMMAQILYNMEGKPAVGAASYPDVGQDWYTSAIAYVSTQGLMSGYSNGNFGPNDAITREQLAVVLRSYAQAKGYDTSASGVLTGFTDGSSVSDWAADGVRWAVGAGLISGKSGGRLDPLGTATRAEIAQTLMSFLENVAK